MFTEKRNAEAARVIDGTPVFLFERLRGFHGDTRGSMAILMAFFAILLMGVGVLAVDVGRMMVLRSQMQNAADAAAKAAALQLNAKSDAFNRGNDAAAIAVQSTNFSGGGGVTLSINTVTYYTEDGWATGTSTAVDYENATIASVTLNAENINLLLRPVLEVLNKSGSANFVTLNASATARLANYICNRAPLFACNPFEGDPTQDFYDIDRHTGKQYTAKGGGGGTIAPGNFGLLDPDTGSGAQAAGNAIATGQPNACGGMDVSVDTGNKAGAIRSGVNTRFDIQGSPAANYPPYGPPNVMEYPDDSAMIDAFFGNSNWDPAAYWAANHASPYPVA
ncbi:MAG: pilus assembly protein TadG-related protein, partial [Rhodospirillales bacterium]|nr:pilus assembly protein TadG-related protein [Rhodospirillales bacterium]